VLALPRAPVILRGRAKVVRTNEAYSGGTRDRRRNPV